MLEGALLRLEPLAHAHEPALLLAARDEAIWRVTMDDPRTPEAMHDYVARALQARDAGAAFPFAVYHKGEGRFIGSTRFHSVSFPDRVEFNADARNARSRAAILRLGAVEEGTLRSKVVLRDGHRRDAMYFSILDREWPGVRERLERSMGEREQGRGA
jgi:RimJ/RimL family protein N-acetyltransferase